jgi:hypothetical protein
MTGAHYPRIRGKSVIRVAADLWRETRTQFDQSGLRSTQHVLLHGWLLDRERLAGDVGLRWRDGHGCRGW